VAAAAAAGPGSSTPPRPPPLGSPGGGHLALAPGVSGVLSPHQLAPLAASSPVFAAAPAIPVSPAGLSQLLEGMQPGGRVSPIGYPARHGISIRRSRGAGAAASGGGGGGGGASLTASLPEPLRGALFGNITAGRTSSTSSSIGSGLVSGVATGGGMGSSSSSTLGPGGWKQGPLGAELVGASQHQVPVGGSGASTPLLLKGGESPARP
jgi:hypothetical protein